MHFIFCLMGKSAAGKDTVYHLLLEQCARQDGPPLREVVPYTTRPARTGEVNGRTYYYETDEAFLAAQSAGKIIEARTYQTVYGSWNYYTKDDGQIDLHSFSYLVIGTLESYLSFQRYFGEDCVIPFYLEVEDGLRLERALRRERLQEHPRYAEMCRRFLADEEDFSEERLLLAGVDRRYANGDAGVCAEIIYSEILGLLADRDT